MMGIFVMIVGLDNFAVSVDVEPEESIASLLFKVEYRLAKADVPHKFTGAYSLVHTCPEGLTEDDPDNIALEKSDPIVMTKYLTVEARLDPAKTVRDYFGESVTPGTASIVLTWPPETLACVKEVRGRDRGEIDDYYAEWDMQPNMGES